MRPFFAILSARFRTLLQYRAAALAGFATQLFWGMLRVMIFTAFYRSTTQVLPMTLQETITYIWLGQAFLLLIPWNMDRDLGAMVRTGNVAYELVRPVPLYTLWFARAIALRTAPVFLRCIPMFLAAVLFMGMTLPVSPSATAVFALSLVGAVLISAAITTLMNLSLFWTISGEGLTRLMPGLVIFFSGIAIPLPLFPDWMQPVLNLLPFRGIMDIPFRLYLGQIPPAQAPAVILQQLAWAAVLMISGGFLARRAVRQLVVQGG